MIEGSEACLRCGGALVAVEEQLPDPGSERSVFAVTEADGGVGRRVAVRLAERNLAQRLFVRDTAGAPRLAGAEIARAPSGDAPAMRWALEGVQTLFLGAAYESPDWVEQHSATVDAAVAAGVERIVYQSFVSATRDATFSYARAHFQVEEHARATGVPCTFLRASPCLDRVPLLCSADGVIENPAGDGCVAYVAPDDVADVVIAALTERGDHEGRTYDVTGPERHTMEGIARELALLAARPISYRRGTAEDARAARSASGGRTWEVEAWVTCFAAIAAGEMDIVSDTVPRLTRHEAQTLAEYLRANPERYQHIVAA
jgi:uncharacterized protein YbjT (DUF2867 family)